MFGVNSGLKIASFLGTTFFLYAAYLFFERLNRRAGIVRQFIALELALLFANPLVSYQFWSAYPDSFFAGEVLLAFVLTDIIATEVERDTRGQIVLLGVVIYAAILTKLYGMILGIACPVYLLLHLRRFIRGSSFVRSKTVLLVGVFGILGLALVLARLGANPTLDFAAELRQGGGYSGYLTNVTKPSAAIMIDSTAELIVALVLNFNFSLFFLLKTGARTSWPLVTTSFAGIVFLGLAPFSGTYYNMRFFIPLLPFVVVPLVKGMLNAKRGPLRTGVLVAYVSAAGFLTVNYNVRPFYELFLPFNERVLQPVLRPRRRIDNLRLGQHLSLRREIERINRVIEPSGTLYWASLYYGTATHGVIE